MVYISEYPVFGKIKTYYQYDTYPNYESIYAVLPLEKEYNKIIPLPKLSYDDERKILVITSDSKIKIIELDYFGEGKLIKSFKQLLLVKFDKSGSISKFKSFESDKSPVYMFLVEENQHNELFLIKKSLLGWKIAPYHSEIDLNHADFEEIVPSQ